MYTDIFHALNLILDSHLNVNALRHASRTQAQQENVDFYQQLLTFHLFIVMNTMIIKRYYKCVM